MKQWTNFGTVIKVRVFPNARLETCWPQLAFSEVTSASTNEELDPVEILSS